MQIERGASNTFALLGRPILSPSYWLLWFRDPERNASVYCIATASNTTGGMLTLTFTETNNPTALNGQVKLSPRGNWELKVYEQTSATNLDPASAGRLVKTIGILVTGAEASDTGWSGTACPPGGGDCDPTTVNGTESDTPTILVQQGGVNVGTLNPATGVHTVPECDTCEPLLVTINGEQASEVTDPCGQTVAFLVIDSESNPVNVTLNRGSIVVDDLPCDTCDPLTYEVYNTEGTLIIEGSQANPCGADVMLTAQDGAAVLKDTAGTTISTTPIPATSTKNITAPNASVQLKDSAANNIGSANSYLSGSTNNLTAPDGTFRTTDGLTTIGAVRSNGTADAPQTQVPYKDAANADQLTTAEDTVFSGGTLRPDTIIPRITIYESDGVTVQGYTDIGSPTYTVDACPACPIVTKFIWQAGDADTYLWTVTADEAGTYGTYTPTGTNGTLTYSLNGGGYAALSGAIILAVSDTITVRRSTTTNAGSVKWEA